ncbi:MAG: hypothetical protein CMH83_11260 [Nocardioides sp.]|nr:hypothetical protein [Nocardioides sp.]
MAAPTTALAVVSGDVLAHGVHYAFVLGGLWGLAALFTPRLVDRIGGTSVNGGDPRDALEARVRLLREVAAAGTLGTPAGAARLAGASPARTTVRPHADDVPLAVVAALAAAGIHAAAAPAHLSEGLLQVAFFAGVAALQLMWALQVAQRPTARLLTIGVVAHVGLIALLVLTRVAALPPVQDAPHPFTGWDVLCLLWEVALVWACAARLQRLDHDPLPTRLPGWFAWHPTARGALGLAATTLVMLTVLGGHG